MDNREQGRMNVELGEQDPERAVVAAFGNPQTPRDFISAYITLTSLVEKSPEAQIGKITLDDRVRSLNRFERSLQESGSFDRSNALHETLLSEMRELLFSFEESGFPSDEEASEIENISKWFGMSQEEIKDSSAGDGVVPELGGISGTFG